MDSRFVYACAHIHEVVTHNEEAILKLTRTNKHLVRIKWYTKCVVHVLCELRKGFLLIDRFFCIPKARLCTQDYVIYALKMYCHVSFKMASGDFKHSQPGLPIILLLDM